MGVIKLKDKKKTKIKGTFTLIQTKKDGEVVRKEVFDNLVVETGIEFLLDLAINNLDNYEENTSLAWMACGSINRAPTADDWRLDGEGTLNQAGGVCRVTLDAQTARTLTTVEFHGVFTTGDFPVIPYSCGEFGAFLGNRPATTDPQNDSSQRPYAMFNRLILYPPWVKYDDETDLRFIYTVTING